ncbi:hypothetical protein Q4553_00850 [Tenacibaculum soleae]|uniref:hypothetical protein n=1 Tax=Tenacibaculum soleae TaxID=447689 RepID=UPI0026E23E13|nr:hypothetical protein [Tenacibaculum soleae]MDO6743111.1 hypothetical protein [Tenacibaculum soleae]
MNIIIYNNNNNSALDKHSLLIEKQQGSLFFLSELIIDLRYNFQERLLRKLYNIYKRLSHASNFTK